MIFELVAQFDQPAMGPVDRDATVIGYHLHDVFAGRAGAENRPGPGDSAGTSP